MAMYYPRISFKVINKFYPLTVYPEYVRNLSTAKSRQGTYPGEAEESYNGLSYEQTLGIRKNNLMPSLVPYYTKPLLIHKGDMQWLFDHTGKRYLDMIGGIVTVSVGHCHPKVNAALEKQLRTLWHTTHIYLHPKIHEFAEQLTSKLPGDLKVAYFVNSGSEANDLTMLLARLHTGNYDIISLQNSYHGMSPYTMGLTSGGAWKFKIPNINSGVHNVMNPDPYTGLWGGSKCRDSPVQTDRSCSCEAACQAGENYIQELKRTFKYSLPSGKVAAMFAESIQGVGGTVQFPRNYIKQAAQLVRDNGGVFVADEVQTGFGRTGDHFWGFESHGIVPDIVTMAKGIGNGFPLAAVVTTEKIANCLNNVFHFNTFGGNPLACSVGLSVLDVIEEEGLQQNSKEVGTYFLQSALQLRDKYEVVGDVRGKGLMLGIELVESKDTRAPLKSSEVIQIWEKCKDLGVLYGKGGINGNVLRIKPPMCVNKNDIDFAIDVLDQALMEHSN